MVPRNKMISRSTVSVIQHICHFLFKACLISFTEDVVVHFSNCEAIFALLLL